MKRITKIMALAMVLTMALTLMPAVSAANAEELKELKVEVFDRGVQGNLPADNNYWTQWIQDNFGTPNGIKVTFVPVARSEEVSKLNVLMASNEAPDVVFTYDWGTVYNYYTYNGIADLTDLIEEYGENITEKLGYVLPYGQIQGRQYAIPAANTFAGTSNSFFIRQDWLDIVGMEVPTNPDELHEVLSAFKQEFGEDCYPFALYQDSPIMPLVYEVAGIDFESDDFQIYTNNSATQYAMPGIKEGFRYLNQLFNEGLISPDFGLDKDGTQMNADMINGVSGFFNTNQFNLYAANDLYSQIQGANPDAVLAPCVPVKHMISNLPCGMFVFVPASSNSKVEAVMYLNWMLDTDNLHYLQFGEENVHFVYNADGMEETLAELPEGQTFNTANNLDMTPIINGLFKSYDDIALIRSYGYPLEYQDDYLASIALSYADMVVQPYFSTTNESAVEFKATLDEKAHEIFVKVVMAPEDQFDAVYDALVAEMLEIGGQEVIDEYAAMLEG